MKSSIPTAIIRFAVVEKEYFNQSSPINQRPQPPMATQAGKDYAAAIKAAAEGATF